MPDFDPLTLTDLELPLSIALVAALIVAIAGWYTSEGEGATLKGLSSDWSFTESWASNVTIGSAALVVLLGSSEIATEIFGDDTDVLSAVVVASGIAAALVAVAPLMVKAFADDGHATVPGVFLGSILTLTGASFETLTVAWNAAEALGSDLWLWVGLAVFLLINYYGFQSLRFIFSKVEESKVPPSDTIRGAEIIARALFASRSLTAGTETSAAIEAFSDEVGDLTGPTPARRKSLVL